LTDYLALALWQGDVTEEDEEVSEETLAGPAARSGLREGIVGRGLEPAPRGSAPLEPLGGGHGWTEALEPVRAEKTGEGQSFGRDDEGDVRGAAEVDLFRPGRALGVRWGAAFYGGPGRGMALDAAAKRGAAGAAVEGRFFGDGAAGEEEAAELLGAVRRAQESARFVEGERRRVSVTLPEGGASADGWSLQALDRAVERDARRYDGGFALY